MEDDYIKTYFHNKDFSIWLYKANYLKNKLNYLKTEKGKGPYKIELFTQYLQLTENFFVNFFSIKDKDLFKNLFLRNNKIYEKIHNDFFRGHSPKNYGNALLSYNQANAHNLLREYVLFTEDKEPPNGGFKYLSVHDETLRFSIIDYLLHKNCLNSYKHGFGFTRTGKGTWRTEISFDDDGKAVFGKEHYNSVIIFLIKRNGVIMEKGLWFNWETIYFRMILLVKMMENMKIGLVSPEKAKGRIELFVLPEPQQILMFGPTRSMETTIKVVSI